MENNDKEKEEQTKTKSVLIKRIDTEAAQKLTQRLYACYSESQILIPNELINSVRNTLEDIDRREEIKRRNKERQKRAGYSVCKSVQRDSALSLAQGASMVTSPANMTVTDPREVSLAGATLPPLTKGPLGQYTTVGKAKDKTLVPMNRRAPSMQGLTPSDIRAQAEAELSMHQSSMRGAKTSRDKTKLPPVKKMKVRRQEKKEELLSHIDIIRSIEDGKNEDSIGYRYCKKGKNFYEFYACHFEDIKKDYEEKKEVTEKKDSDDYITISARGIVHFINKEAEFLSLTEWKDEVENYQKINKINFFKNFRIGKSFLLWKKLVKRTKMIERGSYLTKELFLADSQINKYLILVRKELHTLQNGNIVQLAFDQAQSLEGMSKVIREKQKDLKSALEEVEEKIKSHILKACEGKLQEFNQNTRIFGKEETKKTENKEDLPYHIFADDTYHPMPFTVEASTKTLYKRLARYIKMVDYMFMQLKLHIIKNTFNNILLKLKQSESGMRRVLPIFKVSAKFNNNELTFSPTVTEVKEMLGQRLADGIKMVCTRPMLADEKRFQPYMSTLEDGEEKEEGRINPLKTVDESEDLKDKNKDIKSVLDMVFSQLEEYKKEMFPYIKIYEYHCALNFDELKGQSDLVYRQWMEKFETDRKTISEKLDATKILGIVNVDSNEMKSTVLNKPKLSRETMEKIIPDHSSIIVQKLTKKIDAISEGILPVTVANVNIDEFVRYKKFLELHRRKSDNYEEKLLKARALHMILAEYQIKIKGDHKKGLESLENKWKNVKEKLKQAYEKCEGTESTQKSNLIRKVPEMRDTLNGIIKELDGEKYYKKGENPIAIVEELTNADTRIQNSNNECKKIEDNEAYLQIPKDEFPEKDVLKIKHMHLKNVWADQAFWNEKKVEWFQTPIIKVNTEEMSAKINDMKKVAKEAANVIKEQFNGSFLLAEKFVDEELDPLLSAIKVINSVLKVTVLERHWLIIQKRIDCKLSRDDTNLTLEKLIKLIREANEKKKQRALNFDKDDKSLDEEDKSTLSIEQWIESIAEQAEHEAKLNKEFTKIKNKWDTLLYTTKQINTRLMLYEPEILFAVINECMATLQTILSSGYSAPFKEEADQLFRNISKVEEILEEIVIIEEKMKFVEELVMKEEFKASNVSRDYEDNILRNWKKFTRKQTSGDSGRDTLKQRFLGAEIKDQKESKDVSKDTSKDTTNHLQVLKDFNKKMDDTISQIELKAEEKQIECPRLFFLPTKEFLRIIHGSNRKEAIESCMRKCFASVKTLHTVGEGDEVFPIGVTSAEGEEFISAAKSKNKLGESMDNVFKGIEDIFKKEIKIRITSFFNDYMNEKKSRTELITSTICQVSMATEALIFTTNTETVIEEEEDYEEHMRMYFEEQYLACSEAAKLLTQGGTSSDLAAPPHAISLNDVKRKTLSALIVQYIHYRDVVDFLSRNDVHSINNFHWQMQLRFYKQPDWVIIAKQLDAAFEYGYEYLGVRNPRPITPSTERCWLSYSTALRNKFWSTVVGPQDYGKINTVQDLAASLGKYCYHFICTSDVNAHEIDKLIHGAVNALCWLVLENVNELQYGVLSALASRLQVIRQALIDDKPDCQIMGTKLSQIVAKSPAQGNNCPYFGVFLLVDHSSSNRISVPHTIKSMFRPVSLLSLELGITAEAWLYSFGFKDGNSLGCKLESFLKSAKDLITIEGLKNDLGLRTLYLIIKAAAALKLEQADARSEGQIVLSAIHSIFASRCVDTNLVSVDKLARMIFQEGELKGEKEIACVIKEDNVKQACTNLQIAFAGDATKKIVEMHNAFNKRIACIIVGDSANGKTKLIELLMECYKIVFNDPKEAPEINTIFPKAYSNKELYGYNKSKEWTEGILAGQLSKLSRKDNKKCNNFLHCDGPLDPAWAEQLQTSFEDQKRLALTNGDIIFLEERTKIILEVENLRNTSPSTIARSAVVYVQNELVSPANIIENWMSTLGNRIKTLPKFKDHLEKAIAGIFYTCLAERIKVPKIKEEKVLLSDNMVTLAFCNLFEAVMNVMEPCITFDEKTDKIEKAEVVDASMSSEKSDKKEKSEKKESKKQANKEKKEETNEKGEKIEKVYDRSEKADKKWKELIGKVVVFSLAWACGGSLSNVRQKGIEGIVDANANATDKPKETSCFDAFVRMRGDLIEFVPWVDLAPMFRNLNPDAPPELPSLFKYQENKAYTQMFVPTKNLVRFKWFIEVFSACNKNVMLFGDSGTGKSLFSNCAFMHDGETEVMPGSLVEESVAKPKGATWKFKKMNASFTWNTTSNSLYKLLEDRLEKRRKNLYSPPARMEGIFFIDDVNMPKADSYGTIPAVEFLRGVVERKGYYDCSRYFWKRIINTSFVCNSSPAYGGRKEMSDRFLRHFNVFYLNTMAYTDMHTLFETVILAHFSNFTREFNVVKSGYLDTILDVHDAISQKLPGNPRNPHYRLSYKDAGKVLSGILLGRKEFIPNPDQFSRLALYEIMRVYQDRLTCKKDIDTFIREADKIIEKHMSPKYKTAEGQNILFSNIAAPATLKYVELKDWNEALQIIEKEQTEYNNQAKSEKDSKQPDLPKLDLIFFKEAIEYIIKVLHVLMIPRSHLMNIGPYSLGRKSLVDLAAFIYAYEFHSLENTARDFEFCCSESFKIVKEVVEKAMVTGEGPETAEARGIVLLVKVGETSDGNIIKKRSKLEEEYERNSETILDNVSQILATGDLRNVGEESKCPDARDYVHIIINTPNAVADIRRKMKMYPGIFSECYIVYQDRWPTEAIVGIASALLGVKTQPELKPKIAETVVKMHKIAEEEAKRSWMDEGRKIIVTQKQIKETVKVFLDLYDLRKKELEDSRALLLKAIENVDLSKKVEKEYTEENIKKKPEFEERKKEADDSYAKCKSIESDITKKENEIKEEEEKEKKEGGARLSKKVPAEKVTDGLEKARSELSSAKGRLKGLDWKQLTALPEAAPLVQSVIVIAWIMVNEKHGSWDVITKGMNKKKTDALIGLDITTINDLTMFEAKVIFEETKAIIEQQPGQLSGTPEILFDWETAVFLVYEETKKALVTGSSLEQKKEELYKMMVIQSKESKKYEVLKAERDKINKHRNILDGRCFLLNELYVMLSSENPEWKGLKEWETQRDQNQHKQDCLLTDVLYSSGVVSYFGPFSAISRERIRSEWIKIFKGLNTNIREKLQISEIFGANVQSPDHQLKCLIRDETCTENMFIINHSIRWPLLVDPEGVASKYIGVKSKFKESSSHGRDDLIKEMKQNGEVLFDLVREAVDTDIIKLFELPRKRTVPKLISMGKEDIEVTPAFSLYLRTEHSNPLFGDDIYKTVNVINFGLPLEGVRDLFIIEFGLVSGTAEITDSVLQKEDPQARECIEKEAQLLKQMNSLDISNIDEDEIRVLKDTMKFLQEARKRINEKIEDSKKEHGERRAAIQPLARRAAVLYRSLFNLTRINPMYLFTYDFVKEHYIAGIKQVSDLTSAQAQQQMSIVQMRDSINRVVGYVTQGVMGALERAMFSTDFMLLAFYVAGNIALETKEISHDEWMLFLYGPEYIPAQEHTNKTKNPIPDKIPEKMWNLLSYLEKLNPDVYGSVCKDISSKSVEWVSWITGKTPYSSPIPGDSQKKLIKPAHRVMLMRIVCPERLIEAQEWFTSSVFGEFFLNLKHPTVADLFTKETKGNKPLLIMKEEGEDPTIQVLAQLKVPEETKTAKSTGGEETKVGIFTLTPDTDIDARKAIESFKKSTEKAEFTWVFIREIHTSPEFTTFLAEKLKDATEVNDKFKLVLSCNPCRLPRMLLNSSVRLSMQPTKTMKQKISKDMLYFQQQEIQAITTASNKEKYTPQYRRLTLCLSILHSVLEKRNVFGVKAWTHPYNITLGEVDVANKLVLYVLDIYKESVSSPGGQGASPSPQTAHIPWEAMRKVMNEVCLGGKVLEEYDTRTLGCLIEMFVNEEAANGNYAFKENSPYRIPPANTYTDLMKYVDSIPDADNYEICSMSSEITLMGQRSDLEKILAQYKEIDPRKNMKPLAEALKMEEMDKIDAEVRKLIDDMPEHGLTKDDVHANVMELRKGLPFGHYMFLQQEMTRYNSLIRKIQAIMGKLKTHLDNGELMPPSLEKVYFALAENRVPEEFTGYSWNHPLGEWIITLKKRIEYIRDWLKTGDTKGYWLRALMNPKGLFNSILVTYAQKNEVNVDALSIVFDFTSYHDVSEITEVLPQVGYIYDLYMINARYNIETSAIDEFNIEEQRKFTGPFKYSRLPVISVSVSAEPKEERGDFECPVYYLPTKENKVGDFENLITKIDCPTELKNQYWILKGVTITCIDPELNT